MQSETPVKKYRDFEDDDDGFENDLGLSDNHNSNGVFEDDDDEQDGIFVKPKPTHGTHPILEKMRIKALELYAQIDQYPALANFRDQAVEFFARIDKKKATMGIVAFSLLLNLLMMIRLSTHNAQSASSAAAAGWVRPHKLFGLVRMHMSGDTEINRKLALQYERVCGNSAYSVDAVFTNERTGEYQSHSEHDVVSQLYGAGHDRGRVPDEWMLDMGFDDCDYIAWQTDYQEWDSFGTKELPMELHVPCPDALGHLMEQCHHIGKTFHCGTDVGAEVDKCLHESIDHRFKEDLSLNYHTTMKCFDPSSADLYVNFMGTILQPRRTQVPYTHHGLSPRDESKECIWNQPQVYKNEVLRVMQEKTDYYTFCSKCMGSKDELPL